MISRRRFLGVLGGGAVAAAGLAGCGVWSTERAGALLRSRIPLPERFAAPLPLPEIARPAHGNGRYALTQRAAEVEIIPGHRTEIWGFDGTFPGPTFDVRSGEPITVEITNELPVPTSTHLHGGVTPPQFDGYPTHLVVPAEYADHFDPAATSHHASNPDDWVLNSPSFVHEYPLDQPAATLWYHDHRMDFTGPQVYRGLAGLFIVRDDVDDALPLPKGDKEIPLILADRAFDEDGSFRYPAIDETLLHEPGVTGEYHQGVEGDVILVNGAPWPELEVEASRYRFRILNASNARRYDLRLDPPPPEGEPFVQVGSDVGLLGAPRELDKVVLASAERVDVVVDFGAYPVGTEVVLRNNLDSGPPGDVMRFRIARSGTEDSEIPARLAEYEELTVDDAVARRTFDFRLTAREAREARDGHEGPEGQQGGHRVWTVNGEEFDPAVSLAEPELGTTELWTFTTDFHHPVHVHLGHFQVVGDPEAGWKDTVDVRPYEVVQVLVRFTGYRGRYVMHCHNLEHEDMAMMANFDVI